MRPCDLAFADYIVANGGADSFNIFEAAYEDKLYPYEYPVVKAYETHVLALKWAGGVC